MMDRSTTDGRADARHVETASGFRTRDVLFGLVFGIAFVLGSTLIVAGPPGSFGPGFLATLASGAVVGVSARLLVPRPYVALTTAATILLALSTHPILPFASPIPFSIRWATDFRVMTALAGVLVGVGVVGLVSRTRSAA